MSLEVYVIFSSLQFICNHYTITVNVIKRNLCRKRGGHIAWILMSIWRKATKRRLIDRRCGKEYLIILTKKTRTILAARWLLRVATKLDSHADEIVYYSDIRNLVTLSGGEIMRTWNWQLFKSKLTRFKYNLFSLFFFHL